MQGRHYGSQASEIVHFFYFDFEVFHTNLLLQFMRIFKISKVVSKIVGYRLQFLSFVRGVASVENF